MDIEIRKLTPDLAEDYAQFFDVTPHSERPDDDECKCYCVWWCQDDQNDTIFNRFLSSPERRREYAIQSIQSNSIQGYLAYCGSTVVGWCNTNTKADCLKCFCWRRFINAPTDDIVAGLRVKSIYCFLVFPDMRRKGITKMLLERVCQDAAQDGFDYVEAYPQKEFINDAEDFMGPAGLFAKNGFTVHSEVDDRLVMRKPLK